MPSKTQSILIGAILIAVLTTLLAIVQSMGDPMANQSMGTIIGCLTCIVYIAGGAVAAWHYTSTHSLTLEPGQGALLGMTAGAVGAVIAILVGLLLMTLGVTPSPDEIFEAMERSGAFDEMTDEQAQMTRDMMGWTTGVFGWIIGLVMGTIGGAIGGAIGAAMFKKGPAPEAGY